MASPKQGEESPELTNGASEKCFEFLPSRTSENAVLESGRNTMVIIDL